VLIFHTDITELIDLAHAFKYRDLTDDEYDKYIGEPVEGVIEAHQN
jgi:hypothetical protein